MSDMGEFMMVRMNAGSVLFLVKFRYVTIYYFFEFYIVLVFKIQNRQHLPLGWMLAFLCCGVKGDGKHFHTGGNMYCMVAKILWSQIVIASCVKKIKKVYIFHRKKSELAVGI